MSYLQFFWGISNFERNLSVYFWLTWKVVAIAFHISFIKAILLGNSTIVCKSSHWNKGTDSFSFEVIPSFCLLFRSQKTLGKNHRDWVFQRIQWVLQIKELQIREISLIWLEITKMANKGISSFLLFDSKFQIHLLFH